MKSSIITSAVLGTLVFIVGAKAELLPNTEIGLPNDAVECASWAGTDESRQTLCVALQACERDNSTTKGDALDCISEAQLAYGRSRGPIGEYPEEKESVSTNPGNSDYERRDQKGWEDAFQGGE